jgi:hypothetical protein
MTSSAAAAEGQVIRAVSWREVFGWMHLFRTFRIAMHPSKLALAWVLLLCLYLGGRVLDYAWTAVAFNYVPTKAERIDRYAAVTGAYYARGAAADEREGIFIKFFQYEVGQVRDVVKGVLDWNWRGYDGVVPSVADFLITGPAWFYRAHPVYAAIFTIWFLIVWAIFGGAVARIAAVHVARDEKMSVRQAIRFSSGKMLSFIFAPVIPLILIGLLAVVLGAGGWVLLHVPYVGPILLGLFFFLALLIGGLIALLVLGTGAGFNLMYPTIAVEGSDSFDAISRSFSYVYHRPWRLLWYTAVAVAYGAVCYLVVRFFIYQTLALTHYFLGWWLYGQTAVIWPQIWPPVEFWRLSSPLHSEDLPWSQNVTAWFAAIWVYLLISLLGAFAISFYFSANTIIYALLRREVDATDLDDVYVEEIEEEFSETPPVAAPDKINGGGPVTMTAGPIAGPAVIPPADGGPVAQEGGPDKPGATDPGGTR